MFSGQQLNLQHPLVNSLGKWVSVYKRNTLPCGGSCAAPSWLKRNSATWKKSPGNLKCLPDLIYKIITVTEESTALIVCETSPPEKVSSCSLCKAGPSTEEPRAAEGCGGGRKCTRGHSSKGSWGRPCRCLRNDTDVWRSRWGCDTFWRCCRTEGWTGSLSSPCSIKG